MAVALTMVRMKVAVLRHSMSGQRAGLVVAGGLLGLGLAGGTLFLAFTGSDFLPAAYAVWMLGWILGPVFSGGGDETLKPEYFTLLGLRPRRLAAGLLVSAFVGVAPVISLLALAGLVVSGVRHGLVGAVVALPALALQLAVFVLLSKVAVAVLGVALRSRVGAVGAGVINGAILAGLGQGWVFAVAFGQAGSVPSWVRYLPSGWGLLAITGDWLEAVLGLGALAVLAGLLLAAWAGLLTGRASLARGASTSRGRTRPNTRATAGTGGIGDGAALEGLGAGRQARVVLRKELLTWSRDLVRTHQLTFALAYGLCFAGAPLLLGWTGMLPWAGPIFIVMASGMSANLYGTDGTALWLTLLNPSARDVRGRQLAWLLSVGPVAIALSVVLTAAVGGPWPLVLTLTAALLGGGAGLVPLMSVYTLIPGTDPHRRSGNPLRFTDDDGAATGLVYAMLALTALTAVPAAIIAILYGWPGIPTGLVTGTLLAWGLGLLAQRRLIARGPELLETMRTGRRQKSATSTSFEDLPLREKAVMAVCWSFGAIPLIPQGIVPAAFKITGEENRAWFLALYLPEWLQWPTIVFMILLGLTMYGIGLWIPFRHRLVYDERSDD